MTPSAPHSTPKSSRKRAHTTALAADDKQALKPKRSGKEKTHSTSSKRPPLSIITIKPQPLDFGGANRAANRAVDRAPHPLSAAFVNKSRRANAAVCAVSPIRNSSITNATTASNTFTTSASGASEFEAVGKKRKMENLMGMAEGIAGLGHEMVMGINDMTSLQDMPVPCIMEVERVEWRQTFMGKKATIAFHYINENGVRCLARACVADWVVDQPTPLLPNTVLVYFGKKPKESAPNEFYHDIRRFDGALADKTAARRTADVLRATDRAALEQRFNISNLSAFSAGTVFYYDNISSTVTASGESVCAVRVVDTTQGAVRQQRLVFVPQRYEQAARECCPGVIIYKGLMNSATTKRAYHSITFLRPKDAAEELFNRRKLMDRYTADAAAAASSRSQNHRDR
jgi:hypothetical protein